MTKYLLIYSSQALNRNQLSKFSIDHVLMIHKLAKSCFLKVIFMSELASI